MMAPTPDISFQVTGIPNELPGGDPAFILKDTVEGPNHTRWADSFPIGAEAHLGVGLRVMVRPLQLVDFLVGFAGLDLDPVFRLRCGVFSERPITTAAKATLYEGPFPC